ncbi:MAG: MG2 domain-containing protein, partial [Verrucomicrobiota bacterium]
MRTHRPLVTLIFGNIVWRPPLWARSLFLHTRLLVTVVILLAIIGSGGLYARAWYKKLPKPRKVMLLADSIPVTRLEKDLHPPVLCLRFNDSAAPLDLIGKKVVTGIRMEPVVEGSWCWNDDRHLVFTPAADWPADRKYHVSLEKKAVAPHVLLNRYALDVATAPFAVHVNKLEFYQDPTDPAVKQVVATLEFTHSVAPGELEKHLTLAMLGGSRVLKPNAPPFTVDYGMHHRLAYIHSASITLPEREDFMKLTLSKSMNTAQGGASMKDDLEQKVRVPDRFSFFKIDSTKGNIARRDTGEPDQLLVINTTAETKSSEIGRALEVYLLPKKAEKKEGAETVDENAETQDSEKSNSDEEDNDEEVRTPPAQWESPREVDAAVLKNAKAVKFTVMPTPNETSRQHLFKIQVEGDGSLYVRIKNGVKVYGDFELGNDYDTVLNVPQPPVEIEIQGEGGVLALSGERKLSVRSRGVSMIDYEIARVPADQINHLVSQTEGNFQNPEFICSHFDEADIARIANEKQAINLENHFKSNYSTFDFSNHLKPATDGGSPMQGLFFIKARGWNPKTKKYLRNVIAERFILVTDIGVLVKENTDGSRDVFLQSLAERKPLGGVAVEILARNGVPSVSGTTSPDGRVTFPSPGKPSREKEPVAIVARNGSDVAFIPFARSDRRIDFSRFDVGGIEDVSGGTELDAFVFTERGVYRPGDEIHVAFTVKQHNWGGNLAGLPIETEVVDARGTSVQVKKMALDAGGLTEFIYRTRYESPTGEYAINVYLMRHGKRDMLLGSTSAQVKEFLPDRMKITAILSKPGTTGWINPKEVNA